MNVSLREFQRLVKEEKGTSYIWLSDRGANISFTPDTYNALDHNCYYLATQLNKTRYFKTIKALNTFLRDYFPDVFFKTLSDFLVF